MNLLGWWNVGIIIVRLGITDLGFRVGELLKGTENNMGCEITW
jgi:hypothetical protein